MERKVSIERVGKAVEDAFEMNKSIKEGSVDARLGEVNDKAFGISVVLTDGTTINKGRYQSTVATRTYCSRPHSCNGSQPEHTRRIS